MAVRPVSDTPDTAPQNAGPQKTPTALDKQTFLANVSQQQQPTARERVDSVRDRLSGLTEEYNEKNSQLREPGLKQLKDRLEVLRQDAAKLKNEIADRQLGHELTALQGDLGHLLFAVDHDRVQLLNARLGGRSQELVELVFSGADKKKYKDRLESLRHDVDKLKEELGDGEHGRKLTDIQVGISALGHLADDQTVLSEAKSGLEMLTRLHGIVTDYFREVTKDPTKTASLDDFEISFRQMNMWIDRFERRIASDITAKFHNERAARSVSRHVVAPFEAELDEIRTAVTKRLKKK